jgi:hypothetical protein
MITLSFCENCHSHQQVAVRGVTTCRCGKGHTKYGLNGLAIVIQGPVLLYYQTLDRQLFATSEEGYNHEGEQFYPWLEQTRQLPPLYTHDVD